MSADGKFISADGKFMSVDGKFISADGKSINADGKFMSADGKFMSALAYLSILDYLHKIFFTIICLDLIRLCNNL